MSRQRRPLTPLLMVLLWLLAMVPTAHAGVADAQGGDLEVSLVTYGPGDVYWERFGHDAIELRDRVSGEAVNFNYGVFDFEQKNFLLNFARGHMRYSIDAEPSAEDIAWYVDAGRWVQRQRLRMTAAQAASLRDFLLWNLRPENTHYDYDYYTSNCATRVRDALDRALGGALKAQLQSPAAGVTYRGETDRLMSGQPWLMLLLDLGLGPYADQPLTRWQTAFIPMRLMQEVRGVRVADDHGGTVPLVTGDVRVASARLAGPPDRPPDLFWPLLATGLALALALGVSGRLRRKWRSWRWVFTTLASAYLLFAGLAGLFMTLLWAFTAHRSAWANHNLLLFDPLALLLLPSAWRGHAPSNWARLLLWTLSAIAVAALLVLGLFGSSQHNLPWIAFAVPCWLVLAWTLGAARRTRPQPAGH